MVQISEDWDTKIYEVIHITTWVTQEALLIPAKAE